MIVFASFDRSRHHSSSVSVRHKLQALVYDILPSTIAVFSYSVGSRNCQLTSRIFVGAQTVVSFLQATQIISDVCFMLPCCLRQLKSNQNRLNRDGTFVFTRGGCASCLRACLGARLLSQSYQYPNFSEGADRVGGQLRGDKEQWRN